MENDLNFLSSRAGFNTALRHFKSVNNYVADIDDGYNLADVLQEDLAEEVIQRDQVKSILNALLVDKFGYKYRSFNLPKAIEDAETISKTLEGWTNFDIVIGYYHPQAGLLVINPIRDDVWDDVLPLIPDELMVVYVGALSDSVEEKTIESAVDDIIKLFSGKKVKGKSSYTGKKRRARKVPTPTEEPSYRPEPEKEEAEPEKEEAAPMPKPAGKMSLTPKIAVLVTNELFHNGNVEAWKKIIDSYKAKYPGFDVLIWYENERINDINALFKWGKVKHGTPIMFSVKGDNIKDVSKLKRYLFEGASPRFETFLKYGPDVTLDLF